MSYADKAWSNDLAIGIPEIDDEHEVLLRCLDAISLARSTSWSEAQCFNALEQLDDYARSHFRVEECLMRLLDYPELEDHKLQHAHFVAKIDELRTTIMTEDMFRDLAKLMTNWLLDHIHRIDAKYIAFSKLQGGPILAGAM